MELYKKRIQLLLRRANVRYIKVSHRIKRNVHTGISAYHRQSPLNKKKYLGGAVALVSLILCLTLVTSFWMEGTLAAYEIQLDDKVLGVVRNEEAFWEAYNAVKEEVENTYQQEMVDPENITFNQVKADDTKITEEANMIKNIKSILNFQVKSVALVVDGKEVLLVKDRKTAEEILENIKAPFLNQEGTKYEEIKFSEVVELVDKVTEAGMIKTKEDAVNYIIKGTDEEKIHEVASGESTWTIASKYNLSVEDIVKANPDMNPDRLKIGQKISLVVPKPFISVQTKEYVELVETIPFNTKYEETSSLYEGDSKILKQGLEGKKELKAFIVKKNGVEVGREVLEEKIVSEPTEKLIAKGTKPRPKTMATGIFASPARGRLTSPYGMRWGKMHQGIDIANSIGTPITAADGGRVSFSGRNGAYGNLVIIDHENGYQTYYAHANKLLVKKGERVYKGQKIATVGNTGRSTGPHLHFEVRKNGKAINPSKFVKY